MKRILVPIVASLALTPLAGTAPGSRRRGRRIALLLTAAVLLLAFAGAYLFARFGTQVSRDPGLTSRNERVFSKVLEQGRLAEARGDRASATAAYRFILSVGTGGDPTLQVYVDAARAGLGRVGVPSPP
jgi:hypothetical protein